MVTGRFAPSPSGPMHLGNARTALLGWLDARSRGGEVVLRIEDLDRDRCRPEFADLVRQDLAWLGLAWDRETAPQSTREPAYRAALDLLRDRGLVYDCYCSRRELRVATAPHGPTGERPYPGTCRLLPASRRDRLGGERPPALRVRMPRAMVTVDDRVHGSVRQPVADAVGDIVVRRSDGLHAYQLAVVVDDAADGVTDVVRGDDLLWSTPRQVALARMLGLAPVRHAHVPLVLGADGARLAKRHGATAVAELRARGGSPARVVGELAASAGLVARGASAMPAELVAGFRIADLARGAAVVGEPIP